MDVKNWGAKPEEVRASYPCDALGFAHDDVFHRAVAIAAPPELVYRWLCQVRAAPYSYDLLDNFGRRSPSRLTPGLERLARGQRAMVIFRILDFTPDADLTLGLALRLAAPVMGDFAGSYRVRAAGATTRLAVRVLVRYPRGPYGRFLRLVIPYVDLAMFRKQLLTLKKYSERDARAASRIAPQRRRPLRLRRK